MLMGDYVVLTPCCFVAALSSLKCDTLKIFVYVIKYLCWDTPNVMQYRAFPREYSTIFSRYACAPVVHSYAVVLQGVYSVVVAPSFGRAVALYEFFSIYGVVLLQPQHVIQESGMRQSFKG